ncbi:glycoside hydrolase [Aureobasidium pullulans]|uniref:Glucanase n=1 Tax=Aureobasidium pullulans TaxID=5580 RepID=A0A4S9L3Z9_AURPU|nr:glycoside hydrolase [Aureobasidium pullulans]
MMAVISAFKLLTWILFATISEARATAHGAHRHKHPRAANANGLPKACPNPVVLPDNAFKNRQLYATPYYAAKVAASVKNIADPDLARRAAMIGDVGTFMWIDQKAVIPTIDAMIKGVPCTHIIGLVIYDLPGRDCGGDASGGEYDTGELDRYKAEYIDPLREIFLANPNTAIALAIEPDSLPNAITSLIHPRCAASVQEYKDGIAYALKQFDLPNVVQYIDAGNGNWLGWDPNVAPAAKVIADVWKAAGKPKSCKGIVTNVSNWNAWSMIPGEFENFKDAQYNKAQDEKRYIHLLGAQLAANGMPNHAIVDTSRNGRVGLRTYGGNWCNVKGAGFGIRPTSETDDDLCDAFVWVKVGGESDGGSDPSLPGYDPTCANADAFIPSPRAGSWNQAQFEQLVQNIIPDEYTTDGKCHGNIFCGSWAGGSCCFNGQCGTMCDASAGCTSGCTAPPPDSDPDTTADDNDDYLPEDYIPCDYTRAFSDLDDLNAASDGLRTECLAAYAMSTLITMLDTAYDNYTSVNDGYDEEFGYYVTYVKKLVPKVLDTSFMFDMKKSTGGYPYPGLGMNYFDCRMDKKRSKTLPCTDDNNHEALGNAGLAPDWVVLGDHTIEKTTSPNPPHVDRYNYHFSGFPIENPDISVPNPKDLVIKGLGSIPELRESMQATYLEIVLGLYVGGTTMDAAEAFGTPVFMLMQAVDGMAEAKALGAKEEKEEEEEEKRRKNFILLIISVVFMFVPFVGEELALAAGLATLGRTIAIAGELGNAALATYDTVQDPESAVVNILGMLVGVGAIAKVERSGENIGEVAKLRRGMTAEDVAGLGSVFKNSDDMLQKIIKVCRR